MIEENILKAVSKVTGVSVDDMRGQSKLLAVGRARMMFYYLCSEKGLLQEPIAKAIDKSPQTVSRGILAFKTLLTTNREWSELLNDARGLLLGLGLEEKRDWATINGHDYIYVKGKRYTIVDISSRYSGSGYMGTVNDIPVLYSDSKEDAVRRLIKMTE